MSNQINNLVFTFPGQGSQSIGMLSSFAESYPEVKQIFERASDSLNKDLWTIATNGPKEELDQTNNTQPIMLAAGFAVWSIWCQLSDLRPAWMAGHSLGEYTALACSQAITFEDGIRLVAARGELMQTAVPEGIGAMAAIIGLDDQKVIDICLEATESEIVSAVNFNSPGQVVIAGHANAVNKAMLIAKTAGAKMAILLPVSVPSHCLLMQPAAEKLSAILDSVNIVTPDTKLLHNVDSCIHSSPETIRNALKEQLYKPVQWVETIKFIFGQGASCFVECGPGKVLLGLNKRIVKANHLAIFDSESLNNLLEQFND